MAERKRVLMVCLGNICRSPIAEAVFMDIVRKRNLIDVWDASSAALIDYHVGKPPNLRSITVLKNRGITSYSHKARLMTQDDFHTFDWIFGMDDYIMQELYNMQPHGCKAKIELLGRYDPLGERIIRDPYYDHNDAGFVKAYEQSVRCIEKFLDINSEDAKQ